MDQQGNLVIHVHVNEKILKLDVMYNSSLVQGGHTITRPGFEGGVVHPSPGLPLLVVANGKQAIAHEPVSNQQR